MSYIEKTLTAGEEVVSIFSIHKLFYVIPALTSLILIGIPAFFKLIFTEYGLTNKRVIVKTGVIGRILLGENGFWRPDVAPVHIPKPVNQR